MENVSFGTLLNETPYLALYIEKYKIQIFTQI